MKKTQKNEAINLLKDKFSEYQHFYLADSTFLSVDQVNKLRKVCFEKKVEMKVAKNTLIRKALASLDDQRYSGVYEALHGQTAIMFTENPKEPALIIRSFRKTTNGERPVLKAAFIDSDIYLGDHQVEVLSHLKSKSDLLGEIIGLLQSPVQNVLSGLQSGGHRLAGILKTLEDKAR